MSESMVGWKYVILDSGEVRICQPFEKSHFLMARGEPAVSAGFFSYHPESGRVITSGSSLTLGLSSEEGDKEKILEYFKKEKL